MMSEKQRRNVSRNSRHKKLDMSRKERVLARKKNHAYSSGSFEEKKANIKNIAMLLVTQEFNVPPISTTSELSISHIDNGSISIADWIAYKRIIWGRLPPRPPPKNDSSSNSSSSRRLISRSVPQPVLHSICERATKTDDAIAVLRESLVWKSMASKFSIDEIGIIFSIDYWDRVMLEQRKNVDACLMDTTTQLNARSMKLLKLDIALKDGFDTSLSLDNIDSKSHYFSCCEYELCHEFIKICRKMDYSSK